MEDRRPRKRLPRHKVRLPTFPVPHTIPKWRSKSKVAIIEGPEKMARIGLVDDDPSIRRAVCRLLRSHGYECISYESAETALADSDLLNMDCLVLDVELLGMDGFDLRDRLRGLGAQVPHVFLTAHSESDYRGWASRIGDSSFLTKPVDEDQLLSSIEKLIAR